MAAHGLLITVLRFIVFYASVSVGAIGAAVDFGVLNLGILVFGLAKWLAQYLFLHDRGSQQLYLESSVDLPRIEKTGAVAAVGASSFW